MSHADKRTPTAAGRAYRETYSWMVGSRMLGCTESRQLWTCRLASPEGTTIAVWTPGRATTYTVPRGFGTLRGLDGSVRRVAPGNRVDVGAAPFLLTR